MKKESNGKKKSLLWLWILIGVVAVLAIAGGILAFLFLGQPSEEAEPEKVFFDLYWNVDRAVMVEAETGMSAREPAEDGMYHVRLSVNGELTEVTVADKKLVNRIDLLDAFGLKFDAEGNVVDLIAPEEYYVKMADKAFVQFIEGNTITVNTSQALNGMQIKIDLNSDCIITNVGHLAETPGLIGELEIMDQVLIYGLDEKTPSDIYILDRFWESEVYWRIERFYSSTTKSTTRTQAEDGYWYVDFAVRGKQVTLRTNVEEVINAIDSYGLTSACCGLVFDEEGNIIDCFNAAMAARGYLAASSYDVTELSEDGKTFTATRFLTGADVGKTYTGTVTEDTQIYNVNSANEKFIGEATELKMNDRLYVIADTYGNPKIIYVVNRMVDSPMYYLQERLYSTAKGCTARPDENGYYTIKVTAKGKEYTYKTKDFKLATQIHAYSYRLMGLKVKNGIVLKVYDATCVSGNYAFAPNYFVTGYADPLLSCTSTTGTSANGVLAENVEIYDVSGLSKIVGAKATIRMGDRVICYTNAAGEITHVYITNRKVEGTTLFWNLEPRQYDATKKVSTREPDENGYYTYKVIKAGGKEMTVKTKSKSVADQMDKYTSQTPVALKVNSKGIFSGAYPGWAWNGGYYNHANFWLTEKHPTEPNQWRDIANTGLEAVLTLSDNCRVYNVSTAYTKYRGEATTPKPEDRIYPIYGTDGKVQVLFVWERDVDTKVYRYVSSQQNPDTGVYTFQLAVDGKIKEYTCTDEEVAASIKNAPVAFGLKLSGNKITRYYGASQSREIRSELVSYYDVTKISGNTITLKRNKPGQTDTGAVKTVTKAANCKTYMWDYYVTPNAKGKAATLQLGDRVFIYGNKKGEAAIIYIENECSKPNGGYSYCSHCGKTVWWEPIAAGYTPANANLIPKTVHYYLPGDAENLATWKLYSDKQLDENGKILGTSQIVFDLYGNTRTRMGSDEVIKENVLDPEGNPVLDAEGNPVTTSVKTGRRIVGGGALNVNNGNSLLVIDTKGGGGITIEKDAVMTGNCATILVAEGSKLTIKAGTFDASPATSTYTTTNGGAITVGGELVVNGGTIIGPKSASAKSGSNSAAIGSWGGSKITINGGTVKAAQDGENFIGSTGGAIAANGDLTINGGTIIGGNTRGNGGAIYGGKNTNLLITGGVIKGGYAATNGGNICNQGPTTVITGGTITGGKVDGLYGDNIYVVGNGVVSISGKASIDGGVAVRSTDTETPATLLMEGKIDLDKTGNANTTYDFILENTKVVIGANGQKKYQITNPVLATPVYQSKEIVDIQMTNYVMPEKNWTNSSRLPSIGNVKLMTDITVENYAEISEGLILDLNGHNIIRTAPETTVKLPLVYSVKGGNLQILDSSSTKLNEQGTISVDGAATVNSAGSMIQVEADAFFTLDGGTIDASNVTNTYTTTHNGAVAVVNAGKSVDGKNYVHVGEMTMNGGSIIGQINTAGSSGKSGSALAAHNGAIITINGGELHCNPATSGVAHTGGALASGGRVTINGGTLYGGNVKNHGGAIYSACGAYGGRYWADGTLIATNADTGYLIINGGTINGGKVGANGGAIQASSNVTISGDAVINGGTAGSNGDAIDFSGAYTLSISENAKVKGDVSIRNADAKLVVADEIALTDGAFCFNVAAKYYVDSLDATPTTAEAATEYELVYTSGKVSGLKKVGAPVVPDPDEPDTGAWTEWTSDNSLPTKGKIRLTKDVTISSAVTTTGELVIDLNGYDITRAIPDGTTSATYVFNVAVNTSLHIYDLSTSNVANQGVISESFAGQAKTSSMAGVINVVGSFYLHGGTVDGSNITCTHKAAASTCNATILANNINDAGVEKFGTITINGGQVKGQKNSNVGGTGQGGSALGGIRGTTITVNGGDIYGYQPDSGHACSSGSCIASISEVVINGGTLHGTSTSHRGGTIAITGDGSVAKGHLGKLTITGGTIYGSSAMSGGAIFLQGTGAHSITGGTIIDGAARTAAQGHTVDAYTGNLTIGGNAVVYGGIYVRNTANLVVTGTPVISKELGTNVGYNISLAAGRSIYLNEATGTALTTTAGDYSLTYGTDGKVNGVTTTVAQTEWTETTSLPTSGSIKLTAPVTITEKVTLTGNLTVDLNGQAITRTVAAGGKDAMVFNAPAGTMLTILDSSATPATIAATFADPADKVNTTAGLILVDNGAIGYIGDVTVDGNSITNAYKGGHNGTITTGGLLIIDGATVKGQTSTTGGSGKTGGAIGGWSASHIIIQPGSKIQAKVDGTKSVVTTGGAIATSGNITMNGGEIVGGRAKNHGGTIYVDGTKCEFVMNGGSISGGYAGSNGGNISFNGKTFTMNGGAIYGGMIGNVVKQFGPNLDLAATVTLIMNGGTIQGGVSTRRDGTNSTITINGGSIDCTGSDPAVPYNLRYNKGTVTIGGKTITTAGDYSITYDCMGNVNGFVAGNQPVANGAHTGTAGSACTVCGKTIS